MASRVLSSVEKKVFSALQIDASNPIPGFFNGRKWGGSDSATHSVICPSDGSQIASVQLATPKDLLDTMPAIESAFKDFRKIPAPKRGALVRDIGETLRKFQVPLGQLISIEMGKIVAEGIGEVQEAIDICEYATGLSRMINGKIIPSERPGHYLLESYNPLGPIGVITAFNFPVAVLCWNSSLAWICGDPVIWKPAPSGSLSAIAVTKMLAPVFEQHHMDPALLTLFCGEGDVGSALVEHPSVPLISFTGSTNVGRKVNVSCASQFKKSILELGGNNCSIIQPTADVQQVVSAVVFNAVGTTGQRCTSQRRLLIHESLYDEVITKLKKAYSNLPIGNPLDTKTLVGPLHNSAAVKAFYSAIDTAKAQGGKVLVGGEPRTEAGFWVNPAIVEIDMSADIVQHETFAPVLWVNKYKDLEEAIAINNSTAQGLSSSVFTANMKDVFKWIGPEGSDCGLVNVNTSTSGAEIGGAFGGNKETGWGRESGSDAWRQYCRQSTATINASDELPLAQGLHFGD